MACFYFLVSFSGLCFVLMSSEGRIYPPSGTNLILLPDKINNEIKWRFHGKAFIRTWFFTRRGDTARKTIADISRSGDITIFNKSLPGVSVTPPATLVLKNVDQDYNGKYEFQLTLDDGSNIESYVNVLIAAKPNLTFSCSDTTTLNEGDDFSCLCEGKDGNPPADVTWFKDGKKIGRAGKREQLLTFSNVDNTDSGTYKCVAESDSDEIYKDEKSIKIIVQFEPRKPELTFTSNPAPLGGSVTISCSSDGVPEPSYNITHNGTKVSTEKTFSISPVKWRDAGTYGCFVNNILGSDSVSKYLTEKGMSVIGFASPTSGNGRNPPTQHKSTEEILTEKRSSFFLVFLLVNNYHSDVIVMTDVAGRQKTFYLKPTKTLIKMKRWKTKKSLAVSAVDAGTNQPIKINGQSIIHLKPTIIELISLNVLRIQVPKDMGRNIVKYPATP